MLQRLAAAANALQGSLKAALIALVCTVSLGLSGCVSSGGGLQSYVDSIDGYRFAYPIGWVQVQLTQEGGPDVVFRDLINSTENVSVVINDIPGDQTLAELGSPTEVGYRLQKSALAPENSGRTAELVNAESFDVADKTFYLLEYLVKLPDQVRHDLATVVVHRGQLYTLNASTTEERWERVKGMMRQVVTSFAVS
ncbi:MAG: photosystem II oxygen evolving complex protein PsbP [Synechococcales cyanobacterium RM1_1_8]|nr:photosystem II oxygen evolving complex protein PsbP [Synechococcales cyanobacterium RM1_1_8]